MSESDRLVQFWDKPAWGCCNNPRIDHRYNYENGFSNHSLYCGNCGKLIRDYGSVDYRTAEEKRGSW